jgi:phage terminase small subunit
MTEKLHAEKDSKTAEIKAPSWLSRVGKLMFRRVAKQLNAPETALSDTQTDLICDYVEARLRIASLADMLGADVAEASMFNVDKARIIALSRQIDSTTALSHKIADKLGLTSSNRRLSLRHPARSDLHVRATGRRRSSCDWHFQPRMQPYLQGTPDMSALVAVAFEDRIELLADSAMTNSAPPFQLVTIGPKLVAHPAMPLAMFASGDVQLCYALATEIFRAADFCETGDELVDQLQDSVLRKYLRLGTPAGQHASFHMAFHGPEGGFQLRSFDTSSVSGREPFKLSSNLEYTMFGPVTDEGFRAHGLNPDMLPLSEGLESRGLQYMDCSAGRPEGFLAGGHGWALSRSWRSAAIVHCRSRGSGDPYGRLLAGLDRRADRPEGRLLSSEAKCEA